MPATWSTTTPGEYWQDRLDDWPDAPRGGEPQVISLVQDLRAYLDSTASA